MLVFQRAYAGRLRHGMPQAQAFLLDELEETQAAATSRAPSSLGGAIGGTHLHW